MKSLREILKAMKPIYVNCPYCEILNVLDQNKYPELTFVFECHRCGNPVAVTLPHSPAEIELAHVPTEWKCFTDLHTGDFFVRVDDTWYGQDTIPIQHLNYYQTMETLNQCRPKKPLLAKDAELRYSILNVEIAGVKLTGILN